MSFLKSIFTFKILFFIIFNTTNAQIPNFRIYPSGVSQIEPSISKHPQNPLIMFASAYTISSSFRSEGVYVTTNGGLNWFGSDTCKTGSSTNNHGGDPGPIIDKDGRLIITHIGGFITGMFSNYSTDLGTTWSVNYQIASGDQDKGTPATDDISSSNFYGRTYLAWTKFLSPFPIVCSFTSNGGANWNSFVQINTTPSGHISLGADIKVNYDGAVYVCWAAALTVSPQNEKLCGFAKSTNGGLNWIVNESAYNMNGVKTSILAPWNIRINGYPHLDIDRTGGSRNGYIYIVTGEKNLMPAGPDPDIVFHRSTDGGNTWSPGVRVNQDLINNGKVQYFPAITVDDEGGINVLYYDNRNVSSDSMDVYISRSTNGGLNWRDYRINEHRFRPSTVTGSGGAGNQGDNLGMIFANNRLLPLWMDNYTGVYQVWGALIDVNTIGIRNTGGNIPDDFVLKQNYPNPFNPGTVIGYHIAVSSFVDLKVYDILGDEIESLVSQRQPVGAYEVDFDGSNLPSGVYFYTLKTEGFSKTNSMVLLK
ncbi:MAG: T9SS type A sorting domain-containing protein [Ignavibacteria bacterium]